MIFDRIEEKFRQWNHNFKHLLQSYCPPGYDLTGEYRMFWIWLVFGCIYSMRFLLNYMNAYDHLFYRSAQGIMLNIHMKMPGFWTLLEESFDGLILGIVCLVYAVASHFHYYRKGSKSIYLMKRIADRKLLWKTYIGTACIYGLIFFATGVILLATYYMIYRFVTPQMCLPL